MTEEDKSMVHTAAFFVSICYAPWFLEAFVVKKKPLNDLNAIKEVYSFQAR